MHRGGFGDDRRPIWSDAARSVDPIRASGGVALWRKSEHASHDHHGEREMFDSMSRFQQLRCSELILIGESRAPALILLQQ